jgi:4'-phosphopantetheinyl transferase
MACGGLEDQDTHIWYARLDRPTESLAALAEILSPDEQARAARFHFAQDHDRFITARAILRMLLAGYLATTPSRLRFTYQSHGKPSLADAWCCSGVEFNVAHSNGLAVYAFTRARAIGVDVEYLRPLMHMHRLAAGIFSCRERTAFSALPAHLQPAAFFNGWTRKEAFVKATGAGLATPLTQVEVTLSPGEPAALLGIGGSAAAAAGWSLREFEPARGYVAAVAVATATSRLLCRKWCGDTAG